MGEDAVKVIGFTNTTRLFTKHAPVVFVELMSSLTSEACCWQITAIYLETQPPCEDEHATKKRWAAVSSRER